MAASRNRIALLLVLLVGSAVAYSSWRIYRENNPTIAMVRNAAGQAALERYATTAPDPRVRSAATARVENEDVLVQIATTDADRAVRTEAVRRVVDQALLTQLISDRRLSPSLRRQVLRRIDDDETLLALARARGELSFAAAKQLPEWLLAEVLAEEPPTLRGARELVRKMTNQAALGWLVANAHDGVISFEALQRLHDPAAVLSIAFSHQFEQVALEAARRVHDPLWVRELVADAVYGDVRRLAAGRLASAADLAEVVREHSDEALRSYALRRLSTRDRQRGAQLSLQILAGQLRPQYAGPAGRQPRSVLSEAWRLLRPADLQTLALTGPDRDTRLVALRQVDDEATIQKVARNDPDSRIRHRALERVSDPMFLAEVAMTDQDSSVRRKAVNGIDDPVALEQVVLLSPHTTAAQALKRFDDSSQPLLERAALLARNSMVRRAAVARLDDQSVLLSIAMTDEVRSVRHTAIDGIDDSGLLVELALSGATPQDRSRAARRVTGPLHLQALALAGASGIRNAAIRKVRDPFILGLVATTDGDRSVRRAAVLQMTDEGMLFEVAQQDEDRYVRRKAAQRLTSEELLVRLIPKLEDRDERIAIVHRINAPDLLRQLSVTEGDQVVRVTAIGRISDGHTLQEIIFSGAPRECRRAAFHRLHVDPEAFADVLIGPWDAGFGYWGMSALRDDAALERVAREAWHWRVRSTAIAALGAPLDQRGAHPAVVRRAAEARRIEIVRNEPNAKARYTVIHSLLDSESLRTLARTAYHGNDRRLSVALLAEADEPPPQAPAKVEVDPASDADALVTTVLNAPFDYVAAAAVAKIEAPELLEKIALQSQDVFVLRHILARLEDPAALGRLADGAVDRALQLAAARRLGRQSWAEMAAAASTKRAPSGAFEVVLGAIELLPDELEVAMAACQGVALQWIREGRNERQQDLLDLLFFHGDRTLAEDYYNSHHYLLQANAKEWAYRRDLELQLGVGSQRAIWESLVPGQ